MTATAKAIPPGEIFNPHSQFCGAFIPNWLLRRPELCHGAKLVYGRLAQYAGRDGRCFPKIKTIAKELAIGDSTVHKYLSELQRYGLIQSIRRGWGRPNEYRFLVHIWMRGEFRDGKMIIEPDAGDHAGDDLVEPTGDTPMEAESGAAPDSPAANHILYPRESENSTPVENTTFKEETQKENHNNRTPEGQNPTIAERLLSFLPKIKTQKGGLPKLMEAIPDPEQRGCKPIIAKALKDNGFDYVRRAIEYVNFRKPDSYGAYLRITLRDGYGEQWHRQQAEKARIEAERQQATIRRISELEADRARIDAENAEYERRRQRVFELPGDELAELEKEFAGGLSGLRSKRYRKRGLKAVECDFISYVESVLTVSSVG